MTFWQPKISEDHEENICGFIDMKQTYGYIFCKKKQIVRLLSVSIKYLNILLS